MVEKAKKLKKIIGVLVPLCVVFLTGCMDSPTTSGINTERQPAGNVTLQEQASNLAKILAVDLYENAQHRKEVYAKIACRFDGDNDFLLKDLKDETIESISKLSGSIQNGNTLSKTNSSKTFLASIKKISVNDVIKNFNNLQIRMPFYKNWTDDAIEAKGGLVVAYYPFGVDDKKIKEIAGYNRRGEKIIITAETASSIPYLLISENERVEMRKMIAANNKGLAKRLSQIDIKNLTITEDSNWQNAKFEKLSSQSTIIAKLARTSYSEDPGPVLPKTWDNNKTLYMNGFAVVNVFEFEPYWTNGDPEFALKLSFAPNSATSSTSIPNYCSVYLEGLYDGSNTWYGSHSYKGGWVYGSYWGPVARNMLNPESILHAGCVESDGGSFSIKFSANLGFKIGDQTLSLSSNLDFKDDDDPFGDVLFAQTGTLPLVLYMGNFQCQWDTM